MTSREFSVIVLVLVAGTGLLIWDHRAQASLILQTVQQLAGASGLAASPPVSGLYEPSSGTNFPLPNVAAGTIGGLAVLQGPATGDNTNVPLLQYLSL